VASSGKEGSLFMGFMKRRTTSLVFAIFASAVLVKADSVILKNGSEVKGEILSDGPEGTMIEYFVTPSIKDQKTFSREEIAKVIIIPQDEKAFLALGRLAAPQTILDTSFYDNLLDKKIIEFSARYPYSRHIGELREVTRSLDKERDRLRQGDRKVEGVWFTAKQIANDPYQFAAKAKFAEMRQEARDNDTVSALQTYELLEKSYPGSGVFPDAVELAMSQFDQLQGSLDTAKANFDILEKRRQKALAVAPLDQAKEINNALAKESQAAKDTIKTATADGTKFFPVFPNSKDALDTLQALIISERNRLAVIQKIPMRDGIAAARACERLLAEGNVKEAQDQLANSQKQWPANVDNIRLQQEIDGLLKQQAAAAAAEAAAQAAAAKKH